MDLPIKNLSILKTVGVFICAIAVPVWRPPAQHFNYQIFAMENQVKTSLKKIMLL